jgi:hypothetical protein
MRKMKADSLPGLVTMAARLALPVHAETLTGSRSSAPTRGKIVRAVEMF